MSHKAKAITLCGAAAILLSGCSVPPNTDFYPVVIPEGGVNHRVNELLEDPGFRFAASDENVVEVACQTPESSGKDVSVTLSDLKVAGAPRSELFGSGDNIDPDTLRQEIERKSDWVMWDASSGDILPPRRVVTSGEQVLTPSEVRRPSKSQ